MHVMQAQVKTERLCRRQSDLQSSLVRQNKAAAAAQQACKGLDAQLEIARKQLAACREGGYECMWAQEDQM